TQGLVRIEYDPHVCAGLRVLPDRVDPLGIDAQGSDCRHPPAGPPAIRIMLPGDARYRRGSDLDDAIAAATAADRAELHRHAGRPGVVAGRHRDTVPDAGGR